MAKEINEEVGSGITRSTRRAQRYQVTGGDERELALLKSAMSKMATASQHPWERFSSVVELARDQISDLESRPEAEQHFRQHEGLGWYLKELLMLDKLVRLHLAEGNSEWAAVEGMRFGSIVTEMGIKFEWEADALRGRKLIEGAASTRKANDEDRCELVNRILAERKRGKRDAFLQASRRRPEWGSEGTFRAAFYRKPSKPSD